MSDGDLFHRMLGNKGYYVRGPIGQIAAAAEQIAKIKAERVEPEEAEPKFTDSDKAFLRELEVRA